MVADLIDPTAGKAACATWKDSVGEAVWGDTLAVLRDQGDTTALEVLDRLGL